MTVLRVPKSTPTTDMMTRKYGDRKGEKFEWSVVEGDDGEWRLELRFHVLNFDVYVVLSSQCVRVRLKRKCQNLLVTKNKKNIY